MRRSPLALLASPSACRRLPRGALRNLGMNDDSDVTIATAGDSAPDCAAPSPYEYSR